MTEAEWLAATDPTPMLESLKGKASQRKLRLVSVACCQQVCQAVSEREIETLQFAEKYADKFATVGSVQTEEEAGYAVSNAVAVANACAAVRTARSASDAAHAARLAVKAAISSYLDSGGLRAASEADADAVSRRFGTGDRSIQTALLRDIFGNPFRPVSCDPEWRTSTVLALVKGIYEDRAFDRMPILADALQDAGCDNADILTHCRDTQQVHVRGCWVVDLVLGKQ